MTTPPPPANKNAALKTVLIVGAIVLACALICCCGGVFGLGWWGKNTAKKISSGAKFTVGSVEFNSALPAHIPAYPGAKKNMSAGSTAHNGATMFYFETSDSFSKVRTFYQEKLPTEGWKSVHAMNLGDTGGQDVYRKDHRALAVQTTTANGRTNLTLIESHEDTTEPTTEAQPSATAPAAEH